MVIWESADGRETSSYRKFNPKQDSISKYEVELKENRNIQKSRGQCGMTEEKHTYELGGELQPHEQPLSEIHSHAMEDTMTYDSKPCDSSQTYFKKKSRLTTPENLPQCLGT